MHYCHHTHFCSLTALIGVVLTRDHCQVGARDGITWRLFTHIICISAGTLWSWSGVSVSVWPPSSLAASA